MKTVFVAKDLIKDSKCMPHSDCDAMVSVEVEDDFSPCDMCNAEFLSEDIGFNEDFIWHPKKKF